MQEEDTVTNDLHMSNLSQDELKDPEGVMRNFADDFSLASVQKHYSKMVEVCIISEDAAFAQPSAREDLLFVSKRIVKVFEAAFLIGKRKDHSQRPDVSPEFDVSSDIPVYA